MNILSIDPGTTESELLLWNAAEQSVIETYHVENVAAVRNIEETIKTFGVRSVCIEMVASYGMAVGREVFETCVWIGRLYQRVADAGYEPVLVERREVKLHLCNSARAKDANVRQALIDRFGGKDRAIGRRANPGPLYGVSGHAWAALALAVTFADTRKAA